MPRRMALNSGYLASVATNMRTSSVMNPTVIMAIAALVALVPAAVLLAKFGFPMFAAVTGFVAVLPMLVGCWQIIHFSLKDPDRLQREEHVERKIALQQQAIGIKVDNQIREVPVSAELTANPQFLVSHNE